MDQQARELAPDQQKVFIDELNQIRLVNPALLESSSKLPAESKHFFNQLEQFLQTIRSVREATEKIGQITDSERLKLLALQNELRGAADGAASSTEESKQLQILVNERQKELDRLRVELDSLKVVEAQQNEYLLICKKL